MGSWEWDVPRDQIVASDELIALYGLKPSDFPATFAAFLGIVHPDDRQSVDLAVREALDERDDFVFVARVQGADGWIWTRGRGVSTRDESGRVVALAGTHQDINEVKQAEEALEDQVAQNVLMQAVASASNEASTFHGILVQARDLVLLHDDWERARAFVPDPDGPSVVPLVIDEPERPADRGRPGRRSRRAGTGQRGLPRASDPVGRRPAHRRLPGLVRRPGVRGAHDHVGSPALPPRHDRVDGRAGLGAARSGRATRADRA